MNITSARLPDRCRNRILSNHALLSLLSIICCICGWHLEYRKDISLFFAIFTSLLCFSYFLSGKLLLNFSQPSFRNNVIIQFIFGFFAFNTALYLLTFITSLTPVGNACLLTVIVVFLLGLKTQSLLADEVSAAGIYCILFSGLAASLWCNDALTAPMHEGPYIVFPVWQDAFVHTSHINQFARSAGPGTIFNTEMYGASTPLYHYAMFITPALFVSSGLLGGYESFVSFLLPFGVFLTGLAAFSIISPLLGDWPALAATVAVLIFPDAYQQGFGSRFLSYFFIQMVCPGGLYGVACASIAWIFILDATKSRAFRCLGTGYIMIAFTLLYRAHLFIANSFIALVYPLLKFKQGTPFKRGLLLALIVFLFSVAITVMPKAPGIPEMQFSFTTTEQWAKILLSNTDPGLCKILYTSWLSTYPPATTILSLPLVLIFSTFGLWIFIWIVSIRQKNLPEHVILFPSIILINFIIMGSYLKLDLSGALDPEELLHRPFVWAYFIVISFTTAILYRSYFGNSGPTTLRHVLALGLIVGLCTLQSSLYARNIQTMPLWPTFSSYQTMNSVPCELVDICNYIQSHSPNKDIVQDSENDASFKITSLSERQAFAIKTYPTVGKDPALFRRLDALEAFKTMSDGPDVIHFAQVNKIAWYIAEPASRLAWPSSMDRFCVVKKDGYSLYHFPSDSIH